MCFRPQRQALAQLAQLRHLEFRFQLRLPHQHDLQQLLREGLEIGEHADFFEHFIRQILCLVHNQHRGFARAVTIEQPVVQALQDLALRLRITLNTEVRHHVIEKLGHVHARVEDECCCYLLQPQPFQQLVDQRSLARAHFAGQQNEPFAALDAIGQACQSLLRMPRQEQVTRVRIHIERIRP